MSPDGILLEVLPAHCSLTSDLVGEKHESDRFDCPLTKTQSPEQHLQTCIHAGWMRWRRAGNRDPCAETSTAETLAVAQPLQALHALQVADVRLWPASVVPGPNFRRTSVLQAPGNARVSSTFELSEVLQFLCGQLGRGVVLECRHCIDVWTSHHALQGPGPVLTVLPLSEIRLRYRLTLACKISWFTNRSSYTLVVAHGFRLNVLLSVQAQSAQSVPPRVGHPQ